MIGERVVWSGVDAMYDRLTKISEAWLMALGMMTGIVATNEQVQLTLEPAQRGEQ